KKGETTEEGSVRRVRGQLQGALGHAGVAVRRRSDAAVRHDEAALGIREAAPPRDQRLAALCPGGRALRSERARHSRITISCGTTLMSKIVGIANPLAAWNPAGSRTLGTPGTGEPPPSFPPTYRTSDSGQPNPLWEAVDNSLTIGLCWPLMANRPRGRV